MGLQTLADFRLTVQQTLGNRGFDDDLLDYWVNTAITDLTGRMQFDELITRGTGSLQAGVPIVIWGLPADFFDTYPSFIEIQYLPKKRKLIRIGTQKAFSLDLSLVDDDGPLYWYKEGPLTKVWPSASVGSLQVTDIEGLFLRNHPQLTAPSNKTDFHQRWDRVIHLLACHHALTDLEEADRATYFLNVASRMESQLLEVDDPESRATGMPVQAIESYEQLNEVNEYGGIG